MKKVDCTIVEKTVAAIATYPKAVSVTFKGCTAKSVPTAYFKSGPRKGKAKAWKTVVETKHLIESNMPKFELEATMRDGNAKLMMKLLNPLKYDEDYENALCVMLKNGKLSYRGGLIFGGQGCDIPCFNEELKLLAKDKNFKVWANNLMTTLLKVA